MRRVRRHVLFSMLASFMLLVASTTFIAHVHGDDASGDGRGAQHCDLCLQFNAAGGASASPAAPSRIDTVLAFLRFACDGRSADSRREGGHRSRAPPLLELPL